MEYQSLNELKFTPASVTTLEKNEIFVFGSNTKGHHSGGAALFAKKNFGAIEGQAEGLQGKSYAIPTVGQSLDKIGESVEEFIRFADNHRELSFYVTEIGCKNAGYNIADIAPLFREAIGFGSSNIILPKSFVNYLSIQMEKYWDESCHFFGFEHEGIEYGIVDFYNNYLTVINAPRMAFVPKEVEYKNTKYTVISDHSRGSFEGYHYNEISSINYLGPECFRDDFKYDYYIIHHNLDYYGFLPFPRRPLRSESKRFEVKNGLVIDLKFKRVVQCVDFLANHIVVPEGVEEIYVGAFYHCYLQSIELPKSLKIIQMDAFWCCHELQKIIIPQNVEYIGDYCFSLTGLKEVILEGDKVKTGRYPFHRCEIENFCIPKGSTNKLKKSINSTFVNEMKECAISPYSNLENKQIEFTPDKITKLESNEVFVFGSNLKGEHIGGAARLAYEKFGAVWGLGVGLAGQSYAIPTMHGGVDAIKPYVDQFIEMAKVMKDKKFYVTKIGCGIAGFKIEEMAPLFKGALELENVALPREFVMELKR